MSQTDSRTQQSQEEKSEKRNRRRRPRNLSKSRRCKLALRFLDDNLAVAADTRVFEDTVWYEDRRDASLGVLNIKGAVAANDELRAREDTTQ